MLKKKLKKKKKQNAGLKKHNKTDKSLARLTN